MEDYVFKKLDELKELTMMINDINQDLTRRLGTHGLKFLNKDDLKKIKGVTQLPLNLLRSINELLIEYGHQEKLHEHVLDCMPRKGLLVYESSSAGYNYIKRNYRTDLNVKAMKGKNIIVKEYDRVAKCVLLSKNSELLSVKQINSLKNLIQL